MSFRVPLGLGRVLPHAARITRSRSRLSFISGASLRPRRALSPNADTAEAQTILSSRTALRMSFAQSASVLTDLGGARRGAAVRRHALLQCGVPAPA